MRHQISGWVARFIVLVLAAGPLHAEDWPTYRADAARTGYSPEPLPGNLSLRWTYRSQTAPVPAWPDSSRITFDIAFQPIIVRETVLFGSSAQDHVVAVDAATGERRWAFFTGGPVRFAPAAWRDRVFVASDDGCIYAISIDDGALLWKHRGGPNERMCFGNERMISRWPARGGPVVMDDTVYYGAGIWPSEGVYLYALDTETGEVRWINDSAGSLYMPQPHNGANARSGVAPQGYLLASDERLFVPTGRAVPAAFRRSNGQFEYYRLQENGSIGGTRAILADRFVVNAGCFLERDTGKLAARAGRGVFCALPDGILQSTGKTLLAYRWADLEESDRGGRLIRYRGLQRRGETVLQENSADRQRAGEVIEKLPALGDLYRTEVRFKDVDENVSRQTGLERTLAQARPEVEAMGHEIEPFMATAYERQYEVIGAGSEAVCGGSNVVRVVDLEGHRVRWSHEVEGSAVGLAAANGLLVVSTSKGIVYCFGVPATGSAPSARSPSRESMPTGPAADIDYARAAEEILAETGVTAGICIDLGCGTGELALELVRRSQLYVIGIDSDPADVANARRALDDAGVYGRRVSIHCGDPRQTPYPGRCANLVLSTRSLGGHAGILYLTESERLQRPYGGVLCTGTPGRLDVWRRGPLKEAGQWTHQNCDAANTLCSTDGILRGPLETAWYRDGVLEIVDRHAQGPAPLFSGGYLVVEGVDGICAVDAYNGRTLWTYSLPGILADWDGVHHDVAIGDTGSNFCLSDDSVFVRTDNRCLKIELATGRKTREFRTPVDPSLRNSKWGYVACADGLLFGSVLNEEHTVSPRYANIRLRNESVLFFAMDAKTGKLIWTYKPRHSIRNNAIAIAGGQVYLIDRVIAPADRITDPQLNGKHRPPLQPGEHPGGTLIAIEARTGSIRWKTDDDVFGTQLAVSDRHGVLLMHYQAVKHDFFKLPSETGGRIAAFDVKTGVRLWDQPAEPKTRPLINGETIYAEGGAWALKTGKRMPWEFKRSYGCGQMAGSTHMLVFRSATLGYLDLGREVGTENFGGMRPGCWFNAIIAGGMVLVPDGSSKCACSYQTQPWLALQPQQ